MNRDLLPPLPVDVISIQSQVVYGCVGNSVAVPTLQSFGLNVVEVPTVLLSNVPHYDTLHGGALPTDWFAGFLSDIERRGALKNARAIVLGYLGPPEQTVVLVDWLDRVLPGRLGLKLIVDPVMGDFEHGLYVHPALPPLLRDRLVPMAHGITPNAFELEQLAGRPLPTLADATAAATELLVNGLEWVVVTSAPETASTGETSVLCVTKSGVDVISHARVETYAKGTGDLFTAALVGNLIQGRGIVDACRSAAAKTLAVIEVTASLGCGELVLNDPERAASRT